MGAAQGRRLRPRQTARQKRPSRATGPSTGGRGRREISWVAAGARKLRRAIQGPSQPRRGRATQPVGAKTFDGKQLQRPHQRGKEKMRAKGGARPAAATSTSYHCPDTCRRVHAMGSGALLRARTATNGCPPDVVASTGAGHPDKQSQRRRGRTRHRLCNRGERGPQKQSEGRGFDSAWVIDGGAGGGESKGEHSTPRANQEYAWPA